MKTLFVAALMLLFLASPVLAQEEKHCFIRGEEMVCVTFATLTPTPKPTPTPTPKPPTPTPTPEPVDPMSLRHPDAGVYSVWDGEVKSVNLDNYPYLKGIHIYSKWDEIQPTENGPYNWATLENAIASKTNGNQRVRLYLQINAHWPDWVYNHVARSTFIKRDQHIPQFYDPAYISLYKQFIKDFARYVATRPWKNRVVFVRAQFNAWTPESVTPDGYFSYTNYKPTASGHRYNVNYTYAIGDAYALEITQAYVDAFKPLGIYVVQKSFGADSHENRSICEQYAEMGAGLFLTNNGPNPKRRVTMYEMSTAEEVRSFSEPGVLGHCALQPTADALRFTYWSALSALSGGVEFISFYGCDVLDNSYRFIFNFVDKYAGWYREPEKSPGAWIAFRDIESANRGPEYVPGNYSFLMKQLEPATSTGLFAYTGKEAFEAAEDLNPLARPITGLGPKSQPYGVWARRINGQPIYLNLNDRFVNSLTNAIRVRVVYLDNEGGSFDVIYQNSMGVQQVITVARGNTGKWQEATFTINSYRFANGLLRGADIMLDGSGTFHMVEVIR